jgi:hypothetical protein
MHTILPVGSGHEEDFDNQTHPKQDGVSRSSTTAEIETFFSDVSTTRTNIAIADRSARRCVLPPSPTRRVLGHPVSEPERVAAT